MRRCHALDRHSFAAASDAEQERTFFVRGRNAIPEKLFKVVSPIDRVSPRLPLRFAVPPNFLPADLGPELEISPVGID